MTPGKMRRKIRHLRNTYRPNIKDGATKRSWEAFFITLYNLKLTKHFYNYI